jgi:hypothetical protein
MAKRKTRPPRPPKQCKICLSLDGPWTEEDAYPKWVFKHMRAFYRGLPKNMVPPGWEQSPRTLLKPVCQRCQRRLNVVFEQSALPLLKPMLEGFSLVLSPRQQVILAAWSVKTAYVLGLCPGRLEGVSPEAKEGVRSDLFRMLQTGTPPDEATCRLAYIEYELSQDMRPFLPDGWPDIRRIRNRCTLAITQVLCEILTGFGPTLDPFIDATKNDDRFVRIWPPHVRSQRWPPPIKLGIGDPQALRTAWGDPAQPHGDFAPLIMPPSRKPSAEAEAEPI